MVSFISISLSLGVSLVPLAVSRGVRTEGEGVKRGGAEQGGGEAAQRRPPPARKRRSDGLPPADGRAPRPPCGAGLVVE
jgi:hypothetical protein